MMRAKRFHIPCSLRMGQRSERKRLTRYGQIRGHAIDQFKKETGIGPAFMKLSGGMQVAWAVAKRCGDMMVRDERGPQSPDREVKADGRWRSITMPPLLYFLQLVLIDRSSW